MVATISGQNGAAYRIASVSQSTLARQLAASTTRSKNEPLREGKQLLPM